LQVAGVAGAGALVVVVVVDGGGLASDGLTQTKAFPVLERHLT